MEILYPVYKLSAFAIGASLGSLLNVAILRIPEGRSLWWPPSACRVCGTGLSWSDKLPIVSWLALRGRCRTCGAPVAPMYPLIELLGGLVAWLVFDRFIPSMAQVDLPHVAAATLWYAFCWLMMLAGFTDLRSRIIPEIASLWAIPFGVGAAALLPALGYHGWMSIGWQAAVFGALIGGGMLGTLSLLWRYAFGRDGLGWGDVRLVAMIGAFVGPLPGLWTILLLGSLGGAIAGLIVVMVTRRSIYLPFGPSIAAAAVAWVLCGDTIVRKLFPGMADFLGG